jgi:DNA-binding protein HU-beta
LLLFHTQKNNALTPRNECCDNDRQSSAYPPARYACGSSSAAQESGRPVPIHSMNKGELVQAVQKQLGSETSRAAAERAVAAVVQAIKTGVKKDKLVQLVGFGTFRIVERKARKGVHPKTLQPMKIPKSKTVKFVPAKDFRTRV